MYWRTFTRVQICSNDVTGQFRPGFFRGYIMQSIQIKDAKKGEYIMRKPDAKKVYIRGDYDRAARAFYCTDTEDINRGILIKADKPVFIGFTY